MTMTVTPATPIDNDHEGRNETHPGLQPEGATPSGPLDEIKSGIKAWADIGLTIGNGLKEMSESFNRLMRRLQHNTPVDYGTAAAGVFPASGFLLLNFGSPDNGTRWEVTNVVVGGVDLNTAAIGTAGLYVSGQLPVTAGGAAPAGITAAADYASTLPNVGFYGTRQLVVNDQEYLFLIVFGGTSGQTYAANMSATVFNVDAAAGRDVTIL